MALPEGLNPELVAFARSVGEDIRILRGLIENVRLTPGPAGRDGVDGVDGTDGNDGINGTDGLPGADGGPLSRAVINSSGGVTLTIVTPWGIHATTGIPYYDPAGVTTPGEQAYLDINPTTGAPRLTKIAS